MLYKAIKFVNKVKKRNTEWNKTHSFHSVSFLSRPVDEVNKLAGYLCMCLHSSAGRALQRERRGCHGFESF